MEALVASGFFFTGSWEAGGPESNEFKDKADKVISNRTTSGKQWLSFLVNLLEGICFLCKAFEVTEKTVAGKDTEELAVLVLFALS